MTRRAKQQQCRLRALLGDESEFVFDLLEHVEGGSLVGGSNTRFARFGTSFVHDAYSIEAQWRLKRSLIRQRVRHVTAYRYVDWQLERYWESIKPINREVVASNPDAYRSSEARLDRLRWRESSGSTGRPLKVWYAPEFAFDLRLLTECKIAFIAGAFDADARSRPVFSVALVDNPQLPNRVWGPPDGTRGPTLRVTVDERRPATFRHAIELARRHKAAVLLLKPNILRSILDYAHPSPHLASDLRLIISSGTQLDAHLRSRAEETFARLVVNAYGLTELGIVASECEMRNGLHLYEDDVIAEVMVSDGDIRGEGTGELVLTSVANKAMPFLRYRTGDRVDITSRPCSCGARGRRLARLDGRTIRNFRFGDGTEFSPTHLDGLFRLCVREFRVTQVSPTCLLAEVELLPECQSEAGLNEIRSHISNAVQGAASVQVVATTFREGEPIQRYVTLVDS